MKDLNFRKGDAKTEAFGSDRMLQPSPVERIPDGPTTPEVAYQMVKDETFAQTQPRLNLATFVTTYMDEYATKLMNEAININYIDETEYPRIAVMNGKCINIVANLWNSPEKDTWKTGALAIGSSEACMLGGVAAWLRWRKKRQAQGKPFDKPNFVISTGFQVVWEKFAQLWQIEMREVPLTLDKTTLDPEEALKMCDENTICIVPIQGVTWTGLNDDVEALDKALDAYNAKTGYDIPIHVDAASGGFILPFLYPETKWDFRLKWVLSISVSGHKFGLVYPGLGWVVWKGKEYLPEEMSFSVNYLGANITQVGLNFSRPAAQILGQYYQFIRLGFQGYKEVQYNSLQIAKYIHDEIAKMAPFVNYSNEVVNPLFIWYLKPEYAKNAKWTLYDLQDKLSQHGWMVPAYTLPSKLEDYVVMRVVVRQGFSRDMADMLLGDIKNAITELEKLDYPTPTRIAQEKNLPVEAKIFNHGGRRKTTKK
ncbi:MULTISPECIES: glutamate decarboxylase [Bacteroides]|uniref:glutamate decarboxylase n=1 Tax=Bacteroides TaxID=816 RepID=UPI00164B67CC|nr:MULTISPECIES: glutamate decarboxylase [Bacteroides]MBC5588882.1 glutamate decarboxylase [Bacteroides sp. NSJ-39]